MIHRMLLLAAFLAPGLVAAQTATNVDSATPRIFNTVKLKLKEG